MTAGHEGEDAGGSGDIERLRDDVSVTLLDDGLLLTWPGHQVGLTGACYAAMLPMLVHGRSRRQLVATLGRTHGPAVAAAALQRLRRLGCLESEPPEPSTRRRAVSLTSAGEIAHGAFIEALAGTGVATVGGASLRLVLTDEYARPEVHAIADECADQGMPWLLAKPVGLEVWVGPLFLPGEAPCWECLGHRLMVNRPIQRFVESRISSASPLVLSVAATPASLGIAAWLIAAHVRHYLDGAPCQGLSHTVLTYDLDRAETQAHSVVARPDCPRCGTGPSSPAGQPVQIRSRRVTFDGDGGHRTQAPEHTMARLQHLVSPLTGLVTRLDRTGPPDDAFHVYASTQNLDVARDPDELRRTLGGGKSGKGASDAQSRTSALCEALERYAGSFRGDEPVVTDAFENLPGVLHPNRIMQFSERQYAERERWNRCGSRFNVVPRPFDPATPVGWTPVWSLTHQGLIHVPTALCYYGFSDPEQPGFAVCCSNGCAAGNTLEEAVLQGFLELVERDSIALWWYPMVRRPEIDISSFNLPYLARAQRFLHEQHRDLWLLDLTADLGIPVVAALSRRTDREPERILLGFGAHLDPRIAVLRAVTELHQMLSWVAPMEVDADDVLLDNEVTTWLRTARTLEHPYLEPDPQMPPRRESDLPRLASGDLGHDVSRCQQLVEERGMDMLVLDQTRSDVDLAVVKVFVPGLRHFWARFAPGRLYDVPVALGWADESPVEEHLNPTPMFM